MGDLDGDLSGEKVLEETLVGLLGKRLGVADVRLDAVDTGRSILLWGREEERLLMDIEECLFLFRCSALTNRPYAGGQVK